MKENVRKGLALLLSTAFILSATGCAFLDKSKNEVLDAAEPYAKNLASLNISKLVKSTVKDLKDEQDDWEAKLDFSEGDLYTADAAAALNSIASTISYEIDEESVEADGKKGKGSIEVNFSIADYESVLEDEEIRKVEDFVAAVEDAKAKEIEITLEFEKDDDSWLCSNYDEVFESLYAFTDEEYSFRVPVVEFLNGVNWYGCDWDYGDGYYTNTSYIDVDLDLDWSADGLDYSEIYYTVEYAGSEIYREEGTYTGTLYTYYSGAPVDSESGYLAEGAYTITFYDADDSVIWTGTATVYVEADPTPTPSPSPAPTPSGGSGDSQLIIPGVVYYVFDDSSDLNDKVDQDASVWVDADGNTLTTGMYPSGTDTIEFDLYTTEDLGDIEIQILYNETMLATDESLMNLGYDFISAESTDSGYVYHCIVTGSDIVTGYYALGLFDPTDPQGELMLIAFACIG